MLPHVEEYYKELEQYPDIAKQHKAILKYFEMEDEFIISEISPIRVGFRSKLKKHFLVFLFINVSRTDDNHKINVSYSNDFFGDDFAKLASKYDKSIECFKKYTFDCIPEKMENIHCTLHHIQLMFTHEEKEVFKKDQAKSYCYQYKSYEEIEKDHQISFKYYFDYSLFEMKNLIDFTINYLIEENYNISLHKDDLKFIKSLFNSNFINLKYTSLNKTQYKTFAGNCISLVDEKIITEFLLFDDNGRISNESKELFKINHQI